MKVYQVGGVVRDQLLGHPVKDRDWVVVGATPEEMRRRGYLQVGKDFPVFLHPETKEEYALARTERKTAPGYRGFVFRASPDVALVDDLRRRDLTINAMALDGDGKLIDLFGGREDLRRGLLRHVSPAFVEDPVRLLRVARFSAQLGFEVADETRELLKTLVANGEVDARRPTRFFVVLRECGALARLFPEIDALFGVPQSARSHPEVDTGAHVMMVLDQAARLSLDPQVRFAALTHDLGKGTTPPEAWPDHKDHEERGIALVKALCQRYRAPRDFRDLAVATARYHGDCHRALDLEPGELLGLLTHVDALRRAERFERFLLACEADSRGRVGYEDAPYPQAALCRAARRAAAGVDISALRAQKLKPEAMAEAVRALRVEAVARVRTEFEEE
jgi:tRNA nucleotidyltransferase (CCA-adding enzyme)